MTSVVNYLGNLRTESIHLSSNDKIVTDAPLDNNGKGETFSPTDLVASSLSSCILTVIGIVSTKIKYDLTNTKSSVKKIMGDNPRRIVEIKMIEVKKIGANSVSLNVFL